ncbi:MAG: hypothetical protein ACQEVA_23705 [Myxococcota bacterium]
MFRYALIAIALMLTSGCYSLSTLHTATPVEKGEVAVTVAPTVVGATDQNDEPAIGLDVELMARYGIVDDVDFGIKSGVQRPSFAFDINMALVNNDRFAFSVDPYFSIGSRPIGNSGISLGAEEESSGGVVGLALLNLLFDTKSADWATFTVGAKSGFLAGSSDAPAEDITGFALGCVALIELYVTDTFSIVPTADILLPMTTPKPRPIWQTSIGVQFGS